ncbi:methyltransferase domain-containing protein [Amycolatopsis rhabdoformis]|uniref:Methyltransferase domain-containing protein n=1 Tax=Amycolatopsis rhabdoformis TaxID=1448059 RepID=A0ABZ1I3P4_9PSEU|nr:methyltransferase domain-containing protein [Amycolatopsis rhabdoformis]WSE29024.1 methyltransferase domain-containing protein [Amycolatopsis rhabdoformis]
MPDDFTLARRSAMRWNAPLDETHAALLLSRLDVEGGTVVDLGAGWGELLIRAVETTPARGLAVDTDEVALDRGRRAARDRGARVEFVEQDAATWQGRADRALCVGASHAFGGTGQALAALAGVTDRLLYGDAFWAAEPTTAAVDLLGDDILTLPALLETCRATGWRVLHLSTADQREWDDFESTSRAGRLEWLLAHPDDPRAAETREWLDTREREYVTTYRGVLGFAYLVLVK